jgi:peptidoglycan/xylan/chitin deacetylase (PgdA/CDA1 family)
MVTTRDWAATAFRERLARNWTFQAVRNQATAPLVSFSFDDFPRSAATVGAPILKDFGVKGSYFVSGGRAGRHIDGLDQFVEDDLIRVAEAGHEIGCHTFSHIALPENSATAIKDDLLRNAEFVHRVLGEYTMSSFAYPYGTVSLSKKALMGRFFPMCRGIWSGVNKRQVDCRQLRAMSLERSFDEGKVSAALDQAQASNGWLIFFTHDISDNPSPYGCEPIRLARVLNDVLERGIEILTIKAAAERVRCATMGAAPSRIND